MKEFNTHWEDSNNNKWSKSVFSKEQAIEKSNTLVNCYDCYDCSNCFHCYECNTCHNCTHCSNCHDCYDCSHCCNCINYESNPNRYAQENICIYWNKEQTNITVVYNSFRGSIKEFKKENAPNKYMKFISIAKKIMKKESK